MSNVRVEYLFPNIENKRKLKWLENASFVRNAEDHEVVDLTLEEYLYRFRRERVQYNNNQNKDITKEVNQEHYENWKKRSQSNLFDLDGESIRMDNSMVSALAEHLASHPLELPYFLEQNAINIIGLFLGESILFSNMVLAPSFHYKEYGLCHEQKISEDNYRRSNFEAKYKLSLFLGVIDKLLQKGINLEEFSFVDLRACTTYHNMKDTSLWNQKLIETLDVSSYRRSDSQTFNREEMLSFINFSTLSEFLTCIMNLVEVEYYVNFIEDAVTMNPSEVVELPGYYAKDFSFIKKEDLVSIKELCKSFQNKLKTVALETEVMILERKLEELRRSLEGKKDNFDNSELRKRIEQLYQEILRITTNKRKDLISVLKQILEKNNLDEEFIKGKVKEEGDTSTESIPLGIEAKVEELGRRVDNLEKRVSSLESILKEYLEHGGVIPNLDNVTMSREEMIALIKEYKPTTIGAFLRKVELLKKLKVGFLVALIGGMLFISGSTETTLKDAESVALIPTEEVVEPVVEEEPSIPPVSSEPVEETEELTELSNLKPLEEIVWEVIRGNWGNGTDRREALEKEGYDFDYVQGFVNKVINENVPINQLRMLEEIIIEVAKGKWGEGEEAEIRLARVGYNYQVIQKLIEEMIVTTPISNLQK